MVMQQKMGGWGMGFEWYETTLGEICKFTAGSAFKPEHQGGKAGQYPFIKVSDMNLSGNEIFIRHAQNFVSADLKDEMNAKEHPAGATVFAKIGVALQSNRRRLLVRPTIIDNNMMSATPKAGKISSRFLYFLLSTLDFNTISAGSALPYLNVSDLQKMNVTIPRDGETQHDIENVLGALDDRITLLRETNATLEAIAQALFKSWFVDFDPVRAKMEGRPPTGMDEATAALFPDSFEETELGLVPRGWRVGSIYDIAKITYGAPFASKLFKSEPPGRPLVRIRDLKDEAPGVYTEEVHPKSYLLQPGDITVGMDGEFRAYIWGGEQAWLNQRVCVFHPANGACSAFVRSSITPLLAAVEASETATTVIHLAGR